MISNIGELRTVSFGMLPSVASGGREYFPVHTSQYVYSHFEHVAGTPVDDGSGIAVTKLKLLNTILDQLLAMQKEVAASGLGGRDLNFLTDETAEEQLTPMIVHYQRELQAAVERLENAVYKPSMPETGLLFNMLA